MAIEQKTVAINSATRQVQIVAQFLRAIHDLEEEAKLKDLANINFNNYDAEFANLEELQHIDGSYLNKLEDITNAIRPWLQSQTIGGGSKTYEEQLYEITGVI